MRHGISSPRLFQLSGVRLIELSGEDHIRYLHARVTQDVKGLSVGSCARFLILTPQGRIQGQGTMLRRETNVLVVSDRGAGDNFERALMQFKVADRVQLQNLTQTFVCFFYVSPRGTQALASLIPNVITLKRENAMFQIVEVIVPLSELENFRSEQGNNGIVFGEESELSLIRILSREPWYGEDLDEEIFAGEIDTNSAVSFTKGCYTGQEVVEMTTARGRPNKMLTIFSKQGDFTEALPAAVTAEGKNVGHVTTACKIAERNITLFLGFLKSSVRSDAALAVNGQTISILDSAALETLGQSLLT